MPTDELHPITKSTEAGLGSQLTVSTALLSVVISIDDGSYVVSRLRSPVPALQLKPGLPRIKPYMLLGPHHRGLTTTRTLFTCSLNWKLRREYMIYQTCVYYFWLVYRLLFLGNDKMGA